MSLGRTISIRASHLGCVACLMLATPSIPAMGQSPPASAVEDVSMSAIGGRPDPRPGTISGTVLDASGAVVVGARVSLTRPDRQATAETLSGENGQYLFSNVAPGDFRITVAAAGFLTQTSSGALHEGEFYFAPPTPLLLSPVATEIHVRASANDVAEAQVKEQEKQRVLGVAPNFYVSYIPNAAPLSARQKFELAWKTMADPVTVAMTGAGAGIQQAQNTFSGYGQGARGYSRRFGATYADNATSTFIGSALLPALLKQDPRYFYKGTGSAGSRLLYAVAMSVVAKGDNQHWQPNYSAILGGFASGAISNLYYPPQNRGAALVFQDTLIGTGETAIFNVIQEFAVRRFTTHAHRNDSALDGGSSSQ